MCRHLGGTDPVIMPLMPYETGSSAVAPNAVSTTSVLGQRQTPRASSRILELAGPVSRRVDRFSRYGA